MDKVNKNREKTDIHSKQELQLIHLDKKIDSLKHLYILYFSGELKLPPEKEREELQKTIRSVSQTESRSPRLNMLIQNIISKFSLYNNLWLKKLNELEFGFTPGGKKASPPTTSIAKSSTKHSLKSIQINLNDENSFEKFYNKYLELADKNPNDKEEKERIVNMIKSKMILNNIVIGNIDFSITNGKINLKIKQ